MTKDQGDIPMTCKHIWQIVEWYGDPDNDMITVTLECVSCGGIYRTGIETDFIDPSDIEEYEDPFVSGFTPSDTKPEW